MAWHKIGNSYYNDGERQAQGAEYLGFLIDVVFPGAMTYFCTTALSKLLDNYHFFIVHTTIAKLIYVMAGVFIFLLAYSVRKLVVALSILGIIGFIVFGVSMGFFHWLFA
ncbi:hypothetical protein [Duganella sp. HH101]|uniref:hypothetical protein n=1 Tax=Duganella sp. HH101 TaxID=1781066 RepID=UPI0008748D24|nr:hypothetical protein [Duganella sp. HH101]OFA03721.1 hypothetical protein DUGA2_27590 [Duganella sp. HH101]